MDPDELRALSDFPSEETDYYIDLNRLEPEEVRTLVFVHATRALKNLPRTSEHPVTVPAIDCLLNALNELVGSYTLEDNPS